MTAPYVICFNNGCMADYEASADLIQRLKKGQGLAIQGINAAGQATSLVLPLGDFAKAYDGAPTDPKVFEEQQKKLQQELERRAAAQGKTFDRNANQNAASPSVPPIDASGTPKLVFSPWTKVCQKGQDPNAKLVCFTGKDGRAESGAPVVAAALIEPEGDPKKILRITLPLGMSMQPGTRAIVDQSPPMTAPYVACFNNGCMADYDASADVIQRLKKGQGLVVQAINGTGQAISLVLPLGDFAKAYDGAPTDPKIFEAQQRKLQEDLQKRADESRRAPPR
jgi:invasion protein IalB